MSPLYSVFSSGFIHSKRQNQLQSLGTGTNSPTYLCSFLHSSHMLSCYLTERSSLAVYMCNSIPNSPPPSPTCSCLFSLLHFLTGIRYFNVYYLFVPTRISFTRIGTLFCSLLKSDTHRHSVLYLLYDYF